MESEILKTLKIEKTFKNAEVFSIDNSNTALVRATGAYITIDEFKKIFEYIGELVKKNKTDKLIFDKTKLSVFHQPSMEWYFVEWKEKMFELGLKTHRKILPSDPVFRQSVKIGREQIAEKYPKGKFNLMDIAYSESLEDAIKN